MWNNALTMNNKRTINLSSMKPGFQAMAQRMVDAGGQAAPVKPQTNTENE